MPPRHFGYLLATLLLFSAGCSALPRSQGQPDVLGEDATGAAPVCTVENMAGAKTKRTEVPVMGEMTVQGALEAAGNLPRGSLEVYVIRPTPDRQGPGLKMSCLYSAQHRRVSMETDYAVQAGDRIVLRKGEQGPADELFGAILRPLTGE